MATLITHYASYEIAIKQSGRTLIVKPGKLNSSTRFISNGGRTGRLDINFSATLQNLAS